MVNSYPVFEYFWSSFAIWTCKMSPFHCSCNFFLFYL